MQLVCDSRDSLADKREYLDNVFSKNNYNRDFVRRNTFPAEPNVTNTNATPVTTATTPYMKGTSETIAGLLRTALQHPCRSQTHHHFTTTTDER